MTVLLSIQAFTIFGTLVNNDVVDMPLDLGCHVYYDGQKSCATLVSNY